MRGGRLSDRPRHRIGRLASGTTLGGSLTGHQDPFHKVFAAPGNYNVTGQDVAVLHGWEMAPDAGSYAVTGSDVTFTNSTEDVVGGGVLVDGETDAMGIDFTYHDDRAFQMQVITSSVAVDSDPFSTLTYTSPSLKLCRQSDGVWRYGSHNLFLNSGSPADQSVTVVSGGTYAIVITGATTTTVSGAHSASISAGTTNFTASTTTLTFGSTSGAGTVAVFRTPSVGTYLATGGSVKYDLPYEWDAAGDPLGILIEEQRTNLVTRSREFDNTTPWVKTNSNLTVSSDATTAPDGTSTADKIIPNNVTSGNFIIGTDAGVTVTSGVTGAFSIFAKAAGYNFLVLQNSTAGSGYTEFNLSNGTVSDQVGSHTGSISDAGNGWYRCTMFRTNSSSSEVFRIFTFNATGAGSYLADGTSGIYVWNAQIENGAFPTSPIHTIGATVTRAADNITLATSSFPYSATAGTLVADHILFTQQNNKLVMGITDTGVNEWLGLNQGSANPNFEVYDGGATQCNIDAGTFVLNAAKKWAGAWAANDFATCYDGGTVQTDVSGTLPTLTTMGFGNAPGQSFHINGYLRQATYLARRAPDAELQTRTT